MLDKVHSAKSKELSELSDPFGRHINYIRLSVTDRCDFRCQYCMSEDMQFLPKSEVLTIEELIRLSNGFIDRGIRRIRLTGGEPLVRRGILDLVKALGESVSSGKLDEVTLTTNGSQLEKYADDLYKAGMRRINVSLDTLDADKFRDITRRGDLAKVLRGIDAARAAGLEVKANAVAVKGVNDNEFNELLTFCLERNMGLTLIEAMPLGEIEGNRNDQFYPLTSALETLEKSWDLTPSQHKTGGPARYYTVAGHAPKLGLISPLTNNFCASCNRVRVTCTGQIYLCLGREEHIDLRQALRSSDNDDAFHKALDAALAQKPEGHLFEDAHNQELPATSRHMNVTGG